MPVVTPWAIDVGEELAPLLDDVRRANDEVERAGLRTRVVTYREQIFNDLGVPLPPAAVRTTDQLPSRRVVLSVFEVPYRVIDVGEEDDADTRLEAIDQFVLTAIRGRASDFVGIAETQMLLDQLEQVAPPLPRQVVPKPISLALLADILRRLVEEGVCVRDLRSILEALATAPPTDKDPLSLAELVRSHLRRATTFQLTGGASVLPVYLLDLDVEETIRASVQRTASGSFLALSPAAARDILTAVRKAMTATPVPPGFMPVLLTQPDVRRFARKLVETDFPELKVISYAELLPEISLRPLGRATLGGM